MHLKEVGAACVHGTTFPCSSAKACIGPADTMLHQSGTTCGRRLRTWLLNAAHPCGSDIHGHSNTATTYESVQYFYHVGYASASRGTPEFQRHAVPAPSSAGFLSLRMQRQACKLIRDCRPTFLWMRLDRLWPCVHFCCSGLDHQAEWCELAVELLG